MEQKWSSVVKTGQKVKIKMKGKSVGVVIEKSLFQAKLASNGAIVRPSDNSPVVKKFSS